MSRLIALGDIHGYSASLDALLEAIALEPEDTLVPLGDYIDRGPDSRGVLERLIALAPRRRLMPILGNHDEMLLSLWDGEAGLADWLGFGGRQTLASYGCDDPREIPQGHIDFLRGCLPYHETDRHFFVHASYWAELSLERQPAEALRWDSLKYRRPGPHRSGKTAIVGHTAQADFEILDLGYLKCLDTCCYGGGWLTAMEVNTGQLWQADPEGRLRPGR